MPEPIWITPTMLQWTLALGLPIVALAILLLATRSKRAKLTIGQDRRIRLLLTVLVLIPALGVLVATPLEHDPSNSVYIVDGNLDTGATTVTVVMPLRAHGMMPWLQISRISTPGGTPVRESIFRPRHGAALLAIAAGMLIVALTLSRLTRMDCGPIGRCRHCGYDLRGRSTDRCPECGQATTTNLDGGNPCPE